MVAVASVIVPWSGMTSREDRDPSERPARIVERGDEQTRRVGEVFALAAAIRGFALVSSGQCAERPAAPKTWKCSASDLVKASYDGEDSTHVHLVGFSYGGTYPVTRNKAGTVATGTTAKGTRFTCTASWRRPSSVSRRSPPGSGAASRATDRTQGRGVAKVISSAAEIGLGNPASMGRPDPPRQGRERS